MPHAADPHRRRRLQARMARQRDLRGHGRDLPRHRLPRLPAQARHCEQARHRVVRDRARPSAPALLRVPREPRRRRGRARDHRLPPARRAGEGLWADSRLRAPPRARRVPVERQAALRQDAHELRPLPTPERTRGPHRHQPPRNRQLLVRRLRQVCRDRIGTGVHQLRKRPAGEALLPLSRAVPRRSPKGRS